MKRTVLISGGSKGIGFATAKKCLAEGCRVILIARDQGGLDSAKVKLVDLGNDPEDIALHAADLVETEKTAEWVDQLPWIKEGLWGLVPNAAVEILKTVTEFDHDDMMKMFRVNVLSPISLIQACYPYLKAATGNIVYVGSISDQTRQARYSFYGGTKAFMKSFVAQSGVELGFDGIRINMVTPGATDTELMRSMRAAGAWTEEHIQGFLDSIPIEQRMGAPEEMADTIWFALSGPRFFHGEDIRIFGGHD